MEKLYKVQNSLDTDVSIQFKGTVYTVKSKDILENISEEVKTFWKATHSFLTFCEMSTKCDVETKEVIEEPIVEIKEDVKEEIVVEEEKVEQIIKKKKK